MKDSESDGCVNNGRNQDGGKSPFGHGLLLSFDSSCRSALKCMKQENVLKGRASIYTRNGLEKDMCGRKGTSEEVS